MHPIDNAILHLHIITSEIALQKTGMYEKRADNEIQILVYDKMQFYEGSHMGANAPIGHCKT